MAVIIYADDDAIMRDLVQSVLREAGYVVGVVADGAAALDVVRRRRPDLLILDMAMPGMGGAEALDRLRRDPALYDLPVLVLTARQGESDERITLRAGATEYLRKPFDPDELAGTVDMLIGRTRRASGGADLRRL